MTKNFISKKLYKKFLQELPLCCVDLVVVNNDKFLLVQRKRDPAKNKWWFPGGRIFFGESLVSAAKRKLKEELGIKKIKLIKFLGVGETKFKKGYFNSPSHSVNVVFLVKINNFQAKNIKLDLIDHFGYKWLINTPKRIHPYLKRFLKLAGFK